VELKCDGLCGQCRCVKDYADKRLLLCAALFANLGTDSTEEEVAFAYAEEKRLILEIANVDQDLSDRLLNK
tara:strand:+ start:1576 stop:1788 length:213 start_codon:yes stop_codon:yes gene_type:complete